MREIFQFLAFLHRAVTVITVQRTFECEPAFLLVQLTNDKHIILWTSSPNLPSEAQEMAAILENPPLPLPLAFFV